jgi:hypothetical protein
MTIATSIVTPVTQGLDFSALIRAYDRNLRRYGVLWPDPSQEPGLWYLHQNLGQPVSQQDLTEFYRTLKRDYNKQLRHVAAKGWHLASGSKRATRMPHRDDLTGDQLFLVSVDAPNPIWLQHDRLKRMGRTGAADWSEVLLRYSSHGCAVCGRRFNHYDKGHLDPSKSEVIENLVPMCTECNNWAGQHNVQFKLDGLVARGYARTF